MKYLLLRRYKILPKAQMILAGLLILMSISALIATHMKVKAFASSFQPSSGRLWTYSAESSNAPLQAWDLSSETVTSTFYPLSNPGNGRGVTFDPTDGNLWISAVSYPGFNGDGLIHKVSSKDGTEITHIPEPGGANGPGIGSLDYDPDGNALWAAAYQPVNNQSLIYRLDPGTGAVLKTCSLPFQGGGEGNDTLAIARPADLNGEKVILTDAGEILQTLYALDANTCAIVKTYALPVGLTGIDINDSTGELLASDGGNIYNLGSAPYSSVKASFATSGITEGITLESSQQTSTTSYYDTLVHQQGAIAYWPLDEQSGAATAHNEIAADGTNDGTIMGSNGSSYTLGVVGRGPTESSYLLNGGYVTIPNPTGLATPSFTVSGWVRIPSGHTSNGYLFYNGSGQRDGYGLGVFNGSASGFACVAGGVCAGVASSSVPISDDSWHQLALTKNATTLTLYVDGQPVASNPLSGDVNYFGGEQVDIGRTGPTNSNILSAGVDDVSVYDHALTASDLSALWPAGACPQSTVSDLASGPLPPAGSLPALPLTTEGRYIVDHVQNNLSRVKLASVNWYGFEQTAYAPSGLQCAPLSSIVASIAQRGFNSVRLPWATDSWKSNPVVPDIAVAANPELRSIHLQDLMDKVINELARQGMMTVLDNHTSRPDWCCSTTDGNALWWEDYNPASPPNWNSMSMGQKMQLYQQGDLAWKQALSNIVTRYSPGGSDPQPAVVGIDLRNEPRDDTTLHINAIWGGQGTPIYENWQHAATQAGNVVLSINPNLLVMVEGINFGTMLGGFDGKGDGGVNDLPAKPNTNLTGAAGYPIQLTYSNGQPANQLVYAPHNYEFSPGGTTIDKLGQWWGYLLQTGQTYTAPVWLSEFGTCNEDPPTNCLQQTNQGSWWQTITGYLTSNDIDWSYWAINGTSGQAAPPAYPLYCDQSKDNAANDPNGFRYAGCKETYGILDSAWQTDAQTALTRALQNLETPTQGP